MDRSDALTVDPDRLLAQLPAQATHREAEQLLRAAGWTLLGQGDWASVLAHPRAEQVVRISPFDPVGPYAARLYEQAAPTGLVPQLGLHRVLDGGGHLMVLERLEPMPAGQAARFLRGIADGSVGAGSAARADGAREELVRILHEVHAQAQAELPWCGPLDDNPANAMRRPGEPTARGGGAGRPVLIDPFYADGPALYATAATAPDELAARIPPGQRRWMTEIPLADSGPWPAAEREAMRAAIARADAAATSARRS